MKYILTSLLIFTLLLVFCLCSAGYVTASVKQTEGLLHQAMLQHQLGDHVQAAQTVQAAAANWDSHQLYFGTVLRHDEVDDVMAEFSKLEAYAYSKDQDDFRSNCAGLLATLQHIRDMEWPYLYNIL